MTTRLILDCDTGTDDAVAIMAAAGHPELDLVAVTTVNGNVPLENTTDNTLRVLDHVGADVPVYPGAARPLIRPDFPIPREVLNADSPEFQVLQLDLPEATSTAQQTGAVQFLIDTYLGDEGADIVLVATGPLTNLALALGAEPRLAARIPRLVIMGGGHRMGNVTPTAEFNFWVDPEAAEAVLTAGIRDVTIVPLDATHAAELTLADCDRFDAIGTPAALASSAFVRHRIDTALRGDAEAAASTAVHDAVCVAYLVDPEVVTRSGVHPVNVETTGTRTLGEMIVDTRQWTTEPTTARVAFDADAARFADVLADAFRG
ncbi:purine nucleosidase [Diaminobutyricimonas aerilata]|uniref:Purine nucleosidase n=1 Tax=Diaminobutyricimonas aerilata TaxID=1162967 RepID=A0A2M9CF31_9MICO|nr:nucleoside hydrolase [Diaminobutyricimonas aerilata]PJJ70503.1 purine nucleosidase [Diaminobutyricimonas aerilata]